MRPYRPMRITARGSDMRTDVRGHFFSRIGFQGPASREMRGLHSGHEKAVLGRDEIAKAIRALTPADWIRLNKVAVAYSAGRPIGPEDLLQEAFARAMDGRHCPAGVTAVRFLAEAMRSIAHGEGEKRTGLARAHATLHAVASDGEGISAVARRERSGGLDNRRAVRSGRSRPARGA